MRPADPIDRILLAEAAEGPAPSGVAVLDDPAGELLGEVSRRWPDADVRSYHDSCAAELASRGVVDTVDMASAVRAADLVLARLPKALAALDELAETVAAHGAPSVRLIAAAREKHLGRGMNHELARHFETVRASLGRDKARALLASGPRPSGSSYPRSAHHEDLGLTVCAHGGVFAGTGVDAGTRLLLGHVDAMPRPRRAVDLGCGSGVLASLLARRFDGADVIGVDDSRAAVASTRATLTANGLPGRALVAAELPASLAPVDLIVCNPPFHRGTTKDSAPAFAMFAAAAGVLAPGTGELWVVFNAHLPYLPALSRLVGPTKIAARDRSYLVTRSVSRA